MYHDFPGAVFSGRTDSLLRLAAPPVLAASLACVRPPLETECPRVQPGDLVLTEFREDQPGSYRQWIELYNASDEPIALTGLRLAFTRNDGKEDGSFIVRDDDLVVEPGDYVVLGSDDPERAPYLDYSYLVDWYSPSNPDNPRDLPKGGLVEVLACGELIDRVVLRNLTQQDPSQPPLGTTFWPGEPSAADNDEGANWCVDDFTTSTGIGVFGTPGEANPPCP